MAKNIILRPAYKRPEMFQLSIEYEIEARRAAGVKGEEYLTLFLIEYGAPEKVIEIARSYPYPSLIRLRNRWWRAERKRRYGITRSLLEGMKEGFRIADNHAIVIEDDVLVHKTYFQYIKDVMSLASENEYSAIVASSPTNNGAPDKIVRGRDYSPLAPLISKKFWELYIGKYAKGSYYQNRKKTIIAINKKYEKYGLEKYKLFGTHQFDNHDGLINRLVDVANVEKNMYVVVPEVDRQIHIGFYGTNTPGKDIPGDSYEERLLMLRSIIKDNRLGEYTESSILKFYGFSESLDQWDGSLFFCR